MILAKNKGPPPLDSPLISSILTVSRSLLAFCRDWTLLRSVATSPTVAGVDRLPLPPPRPRAPRPQAVAPPRPDLTPDTALPRPFDFVPTYTLFFGGELLDEPAAIDVSSSC